MHVDTKPTRRTEETEAWVREIVEGAGSLGEEGAGVGQDSGAGYEETRQVVNRLGANVRRGDAKVEQAGAQTETHTVEFGVWWPGVSEAAAVWLELIRFKSVAESESGVVDSSAGSASPDEPWNIREATRYRFEMTAAGDFAWVVIGGVKAGNREQMGDLYSFWVEQSDGSRRQVFDSMALSIPFGLFAPAEVYDMEGVCAGRRDLEYFRETVSPSLSAEDSRQPAPTSMLEIHLGTATKEGSMKAMRSVLEGIAGTLRGGQSERGQSDDGQKPVFSPYEESFLGFDAVQLMPVEPVIEQREFHRFWKVEQVSGEPESIRVHTRKPAVINWGYDIPLFGSAAINPSLLQTGRPHEFLELIETFHTMPDRPVKVVLDLVFGHADNQGLDLLPSVFFSGPNMYGQDVNFRHLVVRAMLLEMLRRKLQWGIDGIRVDGAQDFKYTDPRTGETLYDDEFLRMLGEEKVRIDMAGGDAPADVPANAPADAPADVITDAAPPNSSTLTYRPWMVYEDGRPWPREDWELASTYRAMNDQLDHSFQWAPTIFAYNTPFLYTYWVTKWWRIREVMRFGGRWISGYANHDTMRRGIQADPFTVRYNTMLGDTLKDVIDTSYNSPATTLLMQGFLPGVPMEFVQALTHTPWAFFRDTDTTYALKVVAEESFFLEWQVTPEDFAREDLFARVKRYGFTDLHTPRQFLHHLLRLTEITGYDQEKMVRMVRESGLMENLHAQISTRWLQEFAHDWMRDVADACNAERDTEDKQQTGAWQKIAAKSSFNLATREYRMKNPWLRDSFRSTDRMIYLEPTDGSVIYTGIRRDPDTGTWIFFLANMEGQPKSMVPAEIFAKIWNDINSAMTSAIPQAIALSVTPVLVTPGLETPAWDQPVTLHITQGVLFEVQPNSKS